MRFLLKGRRDTQFTTINDCALRKFLFQKFCVYNYRGKTFMRIFFILFCSGNSLNSIKKKLLIFITFTIFLLDKGHGKISRICRKRTMTNETEIIKWKYLTVLLRTTNCQISSYLSTISL